MYLNIFAILRSHFETLLPPASTRTEAVLLESESDSTSVELYLTVGNIKVDFSVGCLTVIVCCLFSLTFPCAVCYQSSNHQDFGDFSDLCQ